MAGIGAARCPTERGNRDFNPDVAKGDVQLKLDAPAVVGLRVREPKEIDHGRKPRRELDVGRVDPRHGVRGEQDRIGSARTRAGRERRSKRSNRRCACAP
jgi:hypothetical protein